MSQIHTQPSVKITNYCVLVKEYVSKCALPPPKDSTDEKFERKFYARSQFHTHLHNLLAYMSPSRHCSRSPLSKFCSSCVVGTSCPLLTKPSLAAGSLIWTISGGPKGCLEKARRKLSPTSSKTSRYRVHPCTSRTQTFTWDFWCQAPVEASDFMPVREMHPRLKGVFWGQNGASRWTCMCVIHTRK